MSPWQNNTLIRIDLEVMRIRSPKFSARSCWLAFTLLITCLTVGEQGPDAPVAWITENAIPLKTVEVGQGFEDLLPLRGLVGNANIVVLGEATHGTHEFFKMKHRIVEFLAKQMGFTIFSIEANMPEAYRLNEFVLHGSGDPKLLLQGLRFWTWNTQEVLDLILWMREFNKSGQGRIEFSGFDMQSPELPVQIVRSFVAKQDSNYLPTLDRTYAAVPYVEQAAGGWYGLATATVPLQSGAGRQVTLSGYIKTEAIGRGRAGLWLQVDGRPGSVPLFFDNMANRGVKGSTPWTRYQISVNVPAGATGIRFGALHSGDGTAWFDSFRLTVDGSPVIRTDVDLNFESKVPRGFLLSGGGYQIGTDSSIAQSGKQSLRMTWIHPDPAAKSSCPECSQIGAECLNVVQRLRSLRSNFTKDTSTYSLDWATQNAVLVLQFVRMMSGLETRDQAMAENVQWISDQSPGAKLILWTHNDHAAYIPTSGFNPMGGYLRGKFGSKVLNFAFVFNQGSFRAREAQSTKVRSFVVGAAPEGSLDQALANTEIPLFVLDLRRLPERGSARDWFTTPHITRDIGALYRDSDPSFGLVSRRITDCFDVLLFIGQTTPSHLVGPDTRSAKSSTPASNP